MNKIYKIEEHAEYIKMTDDFLKSISLITESNEEDKKQEENILKKIINDLKLNFNLIGIFGSGIGAFYPIVNSLMAGEKIDITSEIVVLSTLCAFTIIYLEEKKTDNLEKQRKVLNDSKNMLAELKLRGVGNGIIKKIISCLYGIKNIFSIITKHIGSVVSGFLDMFSYTSILIPVMNAIYVLIGKYSMTLDNFVDNFKAISIGIATITAKHFIIDIIKKLKSKFPINKKKIIKEIETPVIHKFGDMTYGNEEPEESEETGNQIIHE